MSLFASHLSIKYFDASRTSLYIWILDNTKMSILLLDQYMKCSFQRINKSKHTCVFLAALMPYSSKWIMNVYVSSTGTNMNLIDCAYIYIIIIMYILCLRFNFVDSKRWCLNWNSYAIKMVIFYNSNHNHNNSMLSVCICELVDTCVKFTLWMRHGRVENVVRVSSMSLQSHFNEFWQAQKFKMYDILMLFIALRYRDCYTHQH